MRPSGHALVADRPLRGLLSEVVIDMLRRPLVPLLMVTISALATFLISATAGRTAAAEAAVVDAMELSTSRTIVLSATGDQSISDHALDDLLHLEPLSWVIAFSDAEDVLAGPAELRVPAREYVGVLPEEVVMVEGHPPGPGEALISSVPGESPVVFDPAVGDVVTRDGRVLAVVGRFEAGGSLAFLNGSMLANPGEFSGARTVVFEVGDFGQVESTARAAALLAGLAPSEISVETSTVANDVRSVVTGTLGEFSRTLVAYLGGVCALMLGAVAIVTATLRRAEAGRRRALGATRRVIFILVVGQVMVSSLIGSVIGAVASQLLVVNDPHGIGFGTGVIYLMVLACTFGAVPAAALASTRDPVRVLRLP